MARIRFHCASFATGVLALAAAARAQPVPAVDAAKPAAAVPAVAGPAAAVPSVAGDERGDRLGGGATVGEAGNNSFGFPAPLLTAAERRAFAVGNSFFKLNWVTAPSSTADLDGLGPLFNARSCSGCHLYDGRSRPPEPDQIDRQGLLLRIGVRAAPGDPDRPHPVYGDQIQDAAVLGETPEARVAIRTRTIAGEYGDGTAYELLAPEYELQDLAYGPLGEGVVLSPRTAPQLIGLGLLEAVPLEQLLEHADPDDRDRDGVSGRVHFVRGPHGEQVPGRFGWKAAQPTVLAQTAAAFVNDIGITSDLFPDEALTPAERERIRAPSGGHPEIDAHKLDRVVFYTRTLGVPAQRGAGEPQVAAGRAVFERCRCAVCHVARFVTGDAFHPAYAGQVIHPYTDLLLHDMGPGLADGKRDGDAGPQEWRTPPLWGIGLVPAVNGHSRYLHDGRARNLAEAVLWHDGEAASAKEAFRTASATDRAALLAFLASL
jgi:CxxC motif-containing protein (DUF1111 family)